MVFFHFIYKILLFIELKDKNIELHPKPNTWNCETTKLKQPVIVITLYLILKKTR